MNSVKPFAVNSVKPFAVHSVKPFAVNSVKPFAELELLQGIDNMQIVVCTDLGRQWMQGIVGKQLDFAQQLVRGMQKQPDWERFRTPQRPLPAIATAASKGPSVQ